MPIADLSWSFQPLHRVGAYKLVYVEACAAAGFGKPLDQRQVRQDVPRVAKSAPETALAAAGVKPPTKTPSAASTDCRSGVNHCHELSSTA